MPPQSKILILLCGGGGRVSILTAYFVIYFDALPMILRPRKYFFLRWENHWELLVQNETREDIFSIKIFVSAIDSHWETLRCSQTWAFEKK